MYFNRTIGPKSILLEQLSIARSSYIERGLILCAETSKQTHSSSLLVENKGIQTMLVLDVAAWGLMCATD